MEVIPPSEALERRMFEETIRGLADSFCNIPPIVSPTPDTTSVDIDSMGGHLSVLDNKFSLVLTLNAFLLSVTTFLATNVSDMAKLLATDAMKFEFKEIFVTLSCLIGAFCLLNMWNCLKGVRRVVWGDLGLWIKQERYSVSSTKLRIEGDFDRARADHANL